MTVKRYSLGKIAEFLGASFVGDAECEITGIAPLHKARSGQISFLDNPRYRHALASTQASIVILSPENVEHCGTNAIVMENPYVGYAKVSTLFDHTARGYEGIHPTAIVAPDAVLGANVSLGAHCVVESEVIIESDVILGPGCVVGERCKIGKGTRLWANVTVYYGCRIGRHCIIHSGAVIGSDGFAIAKDKGVWNKILQLGGVEIGDEVEIGANTTIDRGALENTIIEDGVKLDNQIQVAHNVQIGANTAIAGCVGISGSTVIGRDCIIGGGVCINGHLKIVNNVAITGMSMVTKSVTEEGVYSSGTGLQPNRLWRKSVVRFRQLDEIARKVSWLEKKLKEQWFGKSE